MRKRIVALVALCSLAVMFAGCAVTPNSSVIAPLNVRQESPVAVGNTTDVEPAKMGTARSEGILFIGFGNSSIKAAMENGNINRIHHVDSESLNILGIYSRYEVRVYGE
ncbi:MAG: TRL domain-containing protein [Planctomycetota bacterium]